MINKEVLKKEVYRAEKRKLYIRTFIFNIIAIAAITLSISSVGRNQRETELTNKLHTVKARSDSLELVIDSKLKGMEKRERTIIRLALNLSQDTSYSDVTINKDIFGRIDKQSRTLDELDREIAQKWDSIGSIPVGSPISTADLSRVTDGFGWRKHPILKRWVFHEGTDFSANPGTPVMTTADGIVERVVRSRRGYGNRVVINHGYGYKTVYAHLKKFNVKNGQAVKRGDIIGYVGSTGLSTGPHLHYEVRVDGKAVDPKQYYLYGGVYYASK